MAELTDKPALPGDTRTRLLLVATDVFIREGFQNATVREICRLADANVAAVNYHFGDKEKLYSEVLRHWAEESISKYPPDLNIAPNAAPGEKLHAFIRSFFLRIFDPGPGSSYGQLIAREMANPTHALEERVQETMRPMGRILASIIRELAPNLSEDQVRMCSFSVVGQIIFHKNCGPAVCKVFPGQSYDSESVEILARHVTDFSLAGISASRDACKAQGNR